MVFTEPVSLMSDGLLKPLNDDGVLDLLAYLLSRGNKNDAMFKYKKWLCLGLIFPEARRDLDESRQRENGLDTQPAFD